MTTDDYMESAALYRNLQVLAVYMNVCQQKVLLTSLVAGGIPVIALCMSMLVKISRFNDNNIIAPIVSSALGIVSAVFIVLTLKYMSDLYLKSQEGLRRWTKSATANEKARRKRLVCRVAASCLPIRVKFGSTNYIEKQTSLNCIDVACSLTVQILLLTY